MSMSMIWLVEDHPKIRANFAFQLESEGYVVRTFADAESLEAAWQAKQLPDALLVDIRLPKKSGVDLLQGLLEKGSLPPTVIVSGEATISETVEALRLGVYDFLEKPVNRERLVQTVRNCLSHDALKQQVRDLESRLDRHQPRLLGDSAVMQQLREGIAKVAPTDGRVLIRGESGTGKELIATAIHESSRRSSGPFVKINCAALPPNLIEDALFGHVRGAFTDARTDKAGVFEEAHGGTLFLDEIGDMDLALQSRLLRVLEDGTIRRLGDHRDRQVDVRLVTATHRNLESMVAGEIFRQDLFFRINTLPLLSPPLRDRIEDIHLLLGRFLHQFATRHGLPVKTIDREALDILTRHAWPGNVRELKNLCERLVIMGGDPITSADLPPEMFGDNVNESMALPAEWLKQALPLRDFRLRVEKAYISHWLGRFQGNMEKTATALGLQRTYLYQKTSELGIQRGKK